MKYKRYLTPFLNSRIAPQDDWVEVKITDEGQFEFSSYRMIGAWLGSGKLLLENGKLVTEPDPDAGSATFTLYKSNGKRMLKVQGMTKTGLRQAAELRPEKNKVTLLKECGAIAFGGF